MKRLKKKTSLSRALFISLGIPTVFIPGLILATVLGWNWQRDLAKLVKIGGYQQSKTIFPTQAKIVNVLDGDTVEIDNGQTVRMIGIDAPNRGESGYEEAKEYLKDIIADETVRLEYDYYQDDKFGRILAYVWENCTSQMGCKNKQRLINWLLIKRRYAKVVTYDDRRTLKYKDLLLEAEK